MKRGSWVHGFMGSWGKKLSYRIVTPPLYETADYNPWASNPYILVHGFIGSWVHWKESSM
jgi:hypothetical protein